LILLPNVQVLPSQITIYNHPQNQLQLRTSGGSGKHQFVVNDTSIGGLSTTDAGADRIVFVPERIGTVDITIVDTCLGGSDPVHSVITVSGTVVNVATSPY